MALDPHAIAVRERFARILECIDRFTWRHDLRCEEIGSPQRIAPYSYAIEVTLGPTNAELGSGRLVLLHDPAGVDAWQGTHRLVSLVRADTDLEMATDPLLGEVGWSWFTDALDDHDAGYTAPAGTVTVVSSRFFGDMNSEPDRAEVEIRTSWTPLVEEPGDIERHLKGWQQLICQVAGLPPLPEGITPLGFRNGGSSLQQLNNGSRHD
ncbi:DUF3000 domain-containing protein [Propionibacterium sp.]|uniref:DUF3000 domain-containing protein n=1 Tax=Propionibacterium sp. TaxID=1977903 RepID=UPI0039E7444E